MPFRIHKKTRLEESKNKGRRTSRGPQKLKCRTTTLQKKASKYENKPYNTNLGTQTLSNCQQ